MDYLSRTHSTLNCLKHDTEKLKTNKAEKLNQQECFKKADVAKPVQYDTDGTIRLHCNTTQKH